MLVLSRKKGERIVMSCGVTLQVLAVKGNTIRLGIVAPPGTAVLRAEVRDRLRGNTPPPARG